MFFDIANNSEISSDTLNRKITDPKQAKNNTETTIEFTQTFSEIIRYDRPRVRIKADNNAVPFFQLKG